MYFNLHSNVICIFLEFRISVVLVSVYTYLYGAFLIKTFLYLKIFYMEVLWWRKNSYLHIQGCTLGQLVAQIHKTDCSRIQKYMVWTTYTNKAVAQIYKAMATGPEMSEYKIP
jgi:hypothetical protein